MYNDCIFCKIAAGALPAAVFYEDEKLLAVMDAFPMARGHVLLIPKAHARDIYDLPEETAAAILPLAKKIAAAIQEALQPEGLNILQNNGKAAGQVVMHYHLHLIPRYPRDGIRITNEAPPQITAEALADTAAVLRGVLRKE